MHYLQCQDKRKPAVKVNQSNKYLKCLSSKAHGSLSFLLLTSDKMNGCGLAQLDDLWQETIHFKVANHIWHSTGFHCGWVDERLQLYCGSYISLVLRWWMEEGRGFPDFPAPACRAQEVSERKSQGLSAHVADVRMPDSLPAILSAFGISTSLLSLGSVCLKLQVNHKKLRRRKAGTPF